MSIEQVIARLQAGLESLEAAADPRRWFHATYLRTTIAVAEEVNRGGFSDAEWLTDWDVVFAELPNLRHVLLGMNAHVNYDLPQALLAVIPSKDFDDPVLLESRRLDQALPEGVASQGLGEHLPPRRSTPGQRRPLCRPVGGPRSAVCGQARGADRPRAGAPPSCGQRLWRTSTRPASRQGLLATSPRTEAATCAWA